MEIRQFQEHIKKMYFHHDSKRGVENTLKWFLSEVYELTEAVNKGSKKDIMIEAADVVAWLVSLLSLLDIDLEEAVINRYGSGCPKCHSIPCRCEYRDKPNKIVTIKID